MTAIVYGDKNDVIKEGVLLTYRDPYYDPFGVGKSTELGPGRSDCTCTVRAVLKANALLVYDLETVPSVGSMTAELEMKFLLVLERCVAELEEPLVELPYPFVVVNYGRKFYFSCFAEEDRSDWVRAIVGCSQEMIQAKLARCQERLCSVFQQRREYSLCHFVEAGFFPANEPLFQQNDQPPTPWQTLLQSRAFRTLYSRPIVRHFQFEQTQQQKLHFYECMSEPKVFLIVPKQVLNCLHNFFEHILRYLECLDYVPKEVETKRLAHVDQLHALLAKLDRVGRFMDSFRGSPFKASIVKQIDEFEFYPTNLHLQIFDYGKSDGRVDYFTCGAFAAHADGFSNGGLERLQAALCDDCFSDGLFKMDLRQVCNRVQTFVSVENALRDMRCNWWSSSIGLFELDQCPVDASETLALCRQFVDRCRTLQTTLHGQFDAHGDQLTTFTENLAEWFETCQQTTDSSRPGGQWRVESFRSNSDDFQAELASLHTKIENVVPILLAEEPLDQQQQQQSDQIDRTCSSRSQLIEQLRHGSNLVLDRLQSLHSTLTHSYLLAMLLRLDGSSQAGKFYSTFYRLGAVMSQLLTSVVAALLNSLWTSRPQQLNNSQQQCPIGQLWSRCGALVVVHSYLSCNADEMAMLEDMIWAVKLTRRQCRFKLINNHTSTTCMPVVEGHLGSFTVTLPVPSERWHLLPEKLQTGEWFHVCMVLFNVGINFNQSLAMKFQKANIELEINEKACKQIELYLQAVKNGNFLSQRNFNAIECKFNQLKYQVEQLQFKNVDILHQSMALCRLLDASVLVCCKSGKDRTSMGVTLDEQLLLEAEHNLSAEQAGELLGKIRSQGTRIENAYKNIGARRYAFRQWQLNFLPEMYRPPAGFYGSLTT
ncbi:Type I inositol 3,4-bisphosphate 4-phosphatase [Trichinella pseudospiralis]|uniref:Type I inositol 3,4-bisphosphate 4-phosphatase n=1 Tax=Trichinella pseudospiralis TaxID=6337 RepID=A0A0V1G3W9_TRIPS|nr:Type I inositol 3,4-bisphosphate 4-phosphatase [Trichinella pseudospiralis]